jgi:L-fucose isomerase-like protein
MYYGKAGFVGFGEVNTPRGIIERKCNEAMTLLEAGGMKLVSTPPVSDDAGGRDVRRAVTNLSAEGFDALVVCVAGWIPSHAVLGVICEFSNKPIVLWGLSGWLVDGKLVTTADQAGTTALRKVMEDMGYNFIYVYDTPGRKPKADRVAGFLRAAQAAALLRQSKVGMMGYRDMNLYGTLFEGVSLRGRFGVEVEVFEMLEIAQRAGKLNPREIKAVAADARKAWMFDGDVSDETLKTGAGYYLAIRDKMLERGYQAVSLIDVDGMKKLLGFPPAMIFMLIADTLRACVIPENDALGAVTQLIVKYLTGQIAAYFEFYEFMEDRVLVGVPDFVPSEVVDGDVVVRPANFGGIGGGVLNVSKVKTGRVTLCRLVATGDRYALHAVTGEAVAPGPWEEAGWAPPAPQLPSLEVVLDTPVEAFAEKVASQHYILSYGDNTLLLKDFCKILKIDFI